MRILFLLLNDTQGYNGDEAGFDAALSSLYFILVIAFGLTSIATRAETTDLEGRSAAAASLDLVLWSSILGQSCTRISYTVWHPAGS